MGNCPCFKNKKKEKNKRQKKKNKEANYHIQTDYQSKKTDRYYLKTENNNIIYETDTTNETTNERFDKKQKKRKIKII